MIPNNDNTGHACLEYLNRPLTTALRIEHKVHRAPCATSIVPTTPWDNGVRTLLPPTRTSQLNVYEASGVDRAFGHKYELSAVNAPSRVDEDRKETERLRFYSKTSPTIESSIDFLHLITRNSKIMNKNINIFNPINTILIKLIIIRL